jgi:hypothetical protein
MQKSAFWWQSHSCSVTVSCFPDWSSRNNTTEFQDGCQFKEIVKNKIKFWNQQDYGRFTFNGIDLVLVKGGIDHLMPIACFAAKRFLL